MIKYCRSGHQWRSLWWVVCISLVYTLSSCNSKKNLLESQSFLTANKIKIRSEDPIHNKTELKEALQSLYRQRQTKYSLGFPRHVFYYNYQKKIARKPDAKKWDEERVIKNRPIIYDSLKAAQTEEDFARYLAFRGYRYASVAYDATTRPTMLFDRASSIASDPFSEERQAIEPFV